MSSRAFRVALSFDTGRELPDHPEGQIAMRRTSGSERE
jgi:hypothetical protein